MNPIPENTVNAVLTAVILAGCVFFEEKKTPKRRDTAQSLNQSDTRVEEKIDNGP